MPRARSLLAAITFAAASAPSHAALIQLDRDEFDDAIIGLVTAVEDFESFAATTFPSPLVLSNGITFTSTSPSIIGSADKQLLDGTSITGPRVFSTFAADATVFGVDLFLQSSDDYDVIVTTTAGDTLSLRGEDGDKFGGSDGFFGVQVTGGDSLASISFQALVSNGTGPGSGGGGVGNYTFDNVTLAGSTLTPPQHATSIPAPPAFVLVPLALAAAVRRNRVS